MLLKKLVVLPGRGLQWASGLRHRHSLNTDIIRFTTSILAIRILMFLGATAKLRKASMSFVMSIRPYVRMEQLGSHWTNFHDILYYSIFRKNVSKVEVSLKSDKNNEYCT
jgi:hypothetical protein